MNCEKFTLELSHIKDTGLLQLPVHLLKFDNSSKNQIFVLEKRSYSKSLIKAYCKEFEKTFTPEYIQKSS